MWRHTSGALYLRMKSAMTWGILKVALSMVIIASFSMPSSVLLAHSHRTAAAIATAPHNECLESMVRPTQEMRGQSLSDAAGMQLAATPTIVSLTPTSGPVGTRVTLRGTNFTANNSIRLSSGERAFTVDSPVGSENGASLQFRVHSCPSYAPLCPGVYIPPGIYDLSVINANGTSNRVKFTVTPP